MFGVIAALVLIIGAIVWISNGDEQIATSSTIPVVSSTDATLPSTTVEETTTTPPTTVAETTTVPETTVPETTVPETTVPPITAPPRPSGDTWSVTSALFPNDPFTLRRVAQVENLAAYDGVIRATPNGIRCVAIVINGKDGWREWCGNANQPVNFLTIDGIDPWIVEVGAAIGDIALTRQQPSWTLPMNGCTEAVTTLIAAASVVSPAVITGAVCVPGEAFLTNGSVFLQPGPVDGGGALVAGGDEGWDVRNYGTSIGCDDSFDGVDRCALYGVAAELFDAVLPIPPIEALTSTDNVAMSNETGTVRSWVGAETDLATIETIIYDQLNDPDGEVPSRSRRAVGVSYAANLNLFLVEVPAFDDSILSTTWAVWIDNRPPATVIRAYAWQTCARGIAGPDLCL